MGVQRIPEKCVVGFNVLLELQIALTTEHDLNIERPAKIGLRQLQPPGVSEIQLMVHNGHTNVWTFDPSPSF